MTAPVGIGETEPVIRTITCETPEMTHGFSAELLYALVPMVIIIAGAYASVGLGGGSGYLAVMTLVGVPAATMTPTALVLNLVVTLAAFIQFGISGHLKWRVVLPFLVPAMPAAFSGGLVTADKKLFLIVLAITLGIVAIIMARSVSGGQKEERKPSRLSLMVVGIPAGIIIGFLSGFLGIGGGVFLGPLLLLLRWAGPKQVVAINSVIVFSISAIALAAHGIKGGMELQLVVPLAAAAIVGGIAGARLSSVKLSPRTLQRVLAVIVFVAAVKAVCDAAL